MTSKLKYLITFDTNVLLGDPIRSNVLNFIDTYSKDTRFEMTFAVSEIVKKELTKHVVEKFEDASQKYKKSTEQIKFLTDHKFKNFYLDQKVVLKKIDRIFKSKKIKVFSTPYKKINWESIVNKAIAYTPPFEEKKEKGFKDSLIAETIIYHMSKLDKDNYVVFICLDGILKNFMQTLIPTHKQLYIYQSIDDFETYLKLQLLDPNKVDKITAEAAFVFSNETNPNALFWKEKLQVKIYEKYKEIMENPYYKNKEALLNASIYGEILVPANSGRYRIANPTFIRRESESILIWRSSVIFERAYLKSNSIPTHTHVSQHSYSSVHSHSQRTQEIMLYNVEFEIIWKCKMDIEEKIINPTVDQINFINNWRDEQNENINFNYESCNANISLPITMSGQGTTPVSDLTKIINENH